MAQRLEFKISIFLVSYSTETASKGIVSKKKSGLRTSSFHLFVFDDVNVNTAYSIVLSKVMSLGTNSLDKCQTVLSPAHQLDRYFEERRVLLTKEISRVQPRLDPQTAWTGASIPREPECRTSEFSK